jgi:hypothetical protein
MPEQKFDACKEKEIFKEARQEILKENIVYFRNKTSR